MKNEALESALFEPSDQDWLNKGSFNKTGAKIPNGYKG